MDIILYKALKKGYPKGIKKTSSYVSGPYKSPASAKLAPWKNKTGGKQMAYNKKKRSQWTKRSYVHQKTGISVTHIALAALAYLYIRKSGESGGSSGINVNMPGDKSVGDAISDFLGTADTPPVDSGGVFGGLPELGTSGLSGWLQGKVTRGGVYVVDEMSKRSVPSFLDFHTRPVTVNRLLTTGPIPSFWSVFNPIGVGKRVFDSYTGIGSWLGVYDDDKHDLAGVNTIVRQAPTPSVPSSSVEVIRRISSKGSSPGRTSAQIIGGYTILPDPDPYEGGGRTKLPWL